MMNSDSSFQFAVRPDPEEDGAIVVRFEVQQGMGILGLGKSGDDPQPSVHLEQAGVEVDLLRAGRFVHVKGDGQRQSYALSRVTAEAALRLPTDAWTALEAVTEYGFRYLVIPKEILDRVPAAAAVQVSAATPRPAPVRKVTPMPAQPRVEPVVRPEIPRQVPMEPTLAELALDRLERDEAVAFLRSEMAKVEQLHLRVAELEDALQKSQARESDLLEILGRWQER